MVGVAGKGGRGRGESGVSVVLCCMGKMKIRVRVLAGC